MDLYKNSTIGQGYVGAPECPLDVPESQIRRTLDSLRYATERAQQLENEIIARTDCIFGPIPRPCEAKMTAENIAECGLVGEMGRSLEQLHRTIERIEYEIGRIVV